MPNRSTEVSRAQAGGIGALLMLVLLAMWPAFRTPFGIIDDHDIVDIIGHRQRLPVSEMPSEFVYRANDTLGRFRPIYWLGRVLECTFAGRDPFIWWVDRFVLASVCVVAVFLVLRHHLAVVWSVTISFLLLCGAQFETFGRLGPNETYAIPLGCVAVAFIARGVRRDECPARQWPAFVFAILAAGAKENFVVFSGILVVAAVGWFGVRRMRPIDWGVVFATLTLLAADTAMILVKLARYGSQYPQSHNARGMISWAAFADRALDDGGALNLSFVLLLLAFVLRRQRPGRNLTWLMAVVVAGGVLQIMFYAGGPTQGRYLYPLAMVVVVLWAVVVFLARSLANPWVRWPMCLAIGVVVGASVVRGVWTAQVVETAAAERNQQFEKRLNHLERVALREHVDAVVLQPEQPSTDQERVFSLGRYVHADTALPVMTLPATETSGPFSASLGRILDNWSRQGSGRLTPYRPTDRCLSVVFGDTEPVCSLSVSAPG